MAGKLGRRGAPSERARERRETGEPWAGRLIQTGLAAEGWTPQRLRATLNSHPVKVHLPRTVRKLTPMTRAWIAQRRHVGSASYLSALVSVSKDCPEDCPLCLAG